MCDVVSISLQDCHSLFPYSKVDDARCEGAITKPTANFGTYTITSLVSMPKLTITGHKILRISWRSFPAQHLHIIARSLRDGYFYRMDAESHTDAGHYDWPTNILVRTELGPQEIGIVGFFVNEKDEKVFVPLAVQSSLSGVSSALRFVLIPELID